MTLLNQILSSASGLSSIISTAALVWTIYYYRKQTDLLKTQIDGLGFCYQGSWISIAATDDSLIIAEEVSYEVAIGSQFSKIRLLVKNGKVYAETPLGTSELKDPSQILENLKKINEEVVKTKNTELYEKIKKHISY